MTTAQGGLLPADKRLRGSVTFRTGPRANGPRKGIVKQFTFVAGSGFSVARAQALRFLSGNEFSPEPEVIEDKKLFMKATKNAREQDFKEVAVKLLGAAQASLGVYYRQ
ncbi:hypothetical protein PF006_g2245 [Phytophthora fragariae]|uniref:Uncharacterized protein n=1 Tax=Phytophthora fragariae TaxID=53985 RepID=A0A6A3UPX2_9STRA|nr:hypothetical protein PF011_g2052 [Phytophthora fragariae]KAE9153653.1 hypothetical protein PF006_g2245 [Phytophthora fragariae]